MAVFSLNSSTYGSLAAQIGTMAVQDLVGAAGARLAAGARRWPAGLRPRAPTRRGRAPGGGSAPPGLVAIDEFSALGADQVLALFARGREAGVSVLLATQELTDLDRAARGLRDQVIGNTALKIVHRQDVPASAHAVAQMVGSERVWEETRHFGATGGRGAIGPRGTRREVERFRIHPDAIASLPTGAAVLITKVPRAEVRVVQVTPPALAASAPGSRPGRAGRALVRGEPTPTPPARARARGSRGAAPRSAAPRPTPRGQTPARSSAPRSDAPRSDAPRSDTPRSDAARSDAPRSARASDAPRPAPRVPPVAPAERGPDRTPPARAPRPEHRLSATGCANPKRGSSARTKAVEMPLGPAVDPKRSADGNLLRRDRRA